MQICWLTFDLKSHDNHKDSQSEVACIEKQNLEIEHHNENSEKIILKNIQGSNEFDKKRKNLIDFIENLYHKLLAAI
jgi:hypothetical protein